MLLMDFLRLFGFKVKLSVREPIPIQVLELLYLSKSQQDLEEEDINYELDLMQKAREYFGTLDILIAPKNSSITYQKSHSENSEKSWEISNKIENNIKDDFISLDKNVLTKELMTEIISHKGIDKILKVHIIVRPIFLNQLS